MLWHVNDVIKESLDRNCCGNTNENIMPSQILHTLEQYTIMNLISIGLGSIINYCFLLKF